MQPPDADLSLESVLGVCVFLVDEGEEFGEVRDGFDVLRNDIAGGGGRILSRGARLLGFGGLDGAMFDLGG